MDQYRVFGNPIRQSRSPFIHQSFANTTQQALEYRSELVDIGLFSETVHGFMLSGGKGANITVPFKEQALAMCDHLSERAQLAGAVNTLSFKKGKIYGDNTDGIGLVNDLIRHQVVLNNCRVLLLGAGGAAKGVVLPLLERGLKQLVIANRTVSKAQAIVDKFADQRMLAIGFDDANKFEFDLIINATSASLSGESLPISSSVITGNSVCYDMVYAAKLTTFLQKAKDQGAKLVIDGLGMLVEQAAESFFIWRGVNPEIVPVLEQLRDSLKSE